MLPKKKKSEKQGQFTSKFFFLNDQKYKQKKKTPLTYYKKMESH